MTSSSTSSWFLDNAGVVNEAFSRIGIRPDSLTREHFFSATRSLNLALQSFSNRGPNLWQIDLQFIPLIQGVSTYQLPSNTVNILDAYLETYSLATTVNQNPNFSTVIGSSTVTVVQAAHGLVTGNWIEIVVPVSIGGVLLSGFYLATVIGVNVYTIQAAAAATSTVNNGGTVPAFTSTNTLATVSVNLANHGYAVNGNFVVGVSTTVGGIVLFGTYQIITITDANNFVITVQSAASSTQTVSENNGQVQIQTQSGSPYPIDRIVTSISRTDYASYPDKIMQGPPTTFWFDRLSPIPSVTLWQTPDGNGPYAFFYYRMRHIQDAYTTGGQTPDIPYRFLDALCADLANRLARKYAPQLVPALMLEARESWALASEEDRERVQIFMAPDTSGYFR